MKRKILGILLVTVMVVSMLAGCAAKDADSGSGAGNFELALITDVGSIDDKSFNQGSWEGLVQYAKEHSITHKYYKPSEKSTEACLTSIDLAIKGGAKVVVTPGFLFEEPVDIAQEKYPDIKFIILDAAPMGKDGNPDVADNTLSIYYAEEQAGYLAGYAAVVDGHTKLGYMGGIAVPAVMRYGYGFIQGADHAAKDLGIKDVSIKYTYTGNFDASPENMAKAASWYNEGTEVIFACGGAVGNSVMKAAEWEEGLVIGVDVDQSTESETVVTSAMKNLGKSVYDAIDAFYNDSWQGGKSETLAAADDGVQLPMDTSRFKIFDKAKYDEIYKTLSDGSIQLQNDTVGASPMDVKTEIVKVEDVR